MMDERRKFIRLVALVICVPILIAVIAFVVKIVVDYSNRRTVSISNLSDFLKKNNYNESEIDYIENVLYDTIEYNTKNVNIRDLKDVVVRDGSYEERYNSETGVRTVDFIVDIESIRQSYGVDMEWDETDDSENTQADEWGTQVLCLPESKLIYGAFDCKDKLTYTYGTNDPIVKVLPHTEPYRYSIYYLDDYEGGVYKIQIDILTCIYEKEVENEAEARAWMKANIKDLDKYRVDVTYCKV